MPLRIIAAGIEQVDAGWPRLRFNGRTAMLKKAIADILALAIP